MLAVCAHPVEQRDTDVLDDAVQGHELEHTEGCDEGGPAFSVKPQRSRSIRGELLKAACVNI